MTECAASLEYERAVEEHGLVRCDCTGPAAEFLGCDHCPICDSHGDDAVECTLCDEPWNLTYGSVCPPCFDAAETARSMVASLTRALRAGMDIRIHGTSVVVGGVAACFEGDGWPRAAIQAADWAIKRRKERA